MRPYPLIIDIEKRPVFVIGGGRVALRKVEGLLESGAKVIVVSPKLDKDLKAFADSGHIQWIAEPFDESVLDEQPEAALVFGATDNRDVNLKIHDAAIKRKIPCNIADVPDLCTFIVPAVVSRGDLVISISTGGSSPALARRIREDLENQYGPEYAEMTSILAELRKQVLSAGRSSEQNKELFMRIVDSDLLSAIKAKDRRRVLKILTEILPNVANNLIVVATLEMARAVLLEAALSFLGLGVQPPLPSWGLMVSEGRDFMFFQPWLITIPGVALFMLVLSVNLLGDGIRDVTAPESRG